MAIALSTKDNPWNPLTNFNEWLVEDFRLGYDCCGLLDRFAFTSNSLTDSENEAEVERAIDDIIANDPTDTYIKVKDEPIKSSKQTKDDTTNL